MTQRSGEDGTSDQAGQRPQTTYFPRRATRKRSARERERVKQETERRRNDRAAQRIQVPPQLHEPHPLIEQTRQALRQAQADAVGLVHGARCGGLDLACSPALLPRGLLLLDALLKAVVARDWSVQLEQLEGSSAWSTCIVIGDEQVGLRLEEIIESRPHVMTEEERRRKREDPIFFGAPRQDRVASGRLQLSISPCYAGRGHWSDTRRSVLEQCLDLCLRAMEATAAAAPEQRRSLEQARSDWEAAERKRIESEHEQRREQLRQAVLKAQEEARVQVLASHLERMRLADAARDYLRRLGDAAAAQGTSVAAEARLGQWMAWVAQHIQKLDPCRPGVVEAEKSLWPGRETG